MVEGKEGRLPLKFSQFQSQRHNYQGSAHDNVRWSLISDQSQIDIFMSSLHLAPSENTENLYEMTLVEHFGMFHCFYLYKILSYQMGKLL